MREFLFSTFLFSLLSSVSLAQSKKDTAGFADAKGFVLCHCISYGYKKIDSTLKLEDYSGSYFIQMTAVPYDSLNKFVQNNFLKYWGEPMERAAIPRANMVAYTCWRMYESKQLAAYIRKILKLINKHI